MINKEYRPEGYNTVEKGIGKDRLREAFISGEILEAKVIKSDKNLRLYLDLGDDIEATLDSREFDSVSNSEIKTIAILKKVGKVVAFKVIDLIEDGDTMKIKVSRRLAKEECKKNYVDKLKPGDIVDAKVTHIENYGLFCDIGCGNLTLLPIENVCKARIIEPKKSLRDVKRIKAVIKKIDKQGKITLTHKELLGTWTDEASKFNVGETVVGVVRSKESYGTFVELTPNLAGLAQSEFEAEPGDKVIVKIVNIVPSKMKVKLVIIGVDGKEDTHERPYFKYVKTNGRIEEWVYSPDVSDKKIVTRFE